MSKSTITNKLYLLFQHCIRNAELLQTNTLLFFTTTTTQTLRKFRSQAVSLIWKKRWTTIKEKYTVNLKEKYVLSIKSILKISSSLSNSVRTKNIQRESEK